VYPSAPPFPWRGWVAAGLVVALLLWSAQGTGFSLKELTSGFPEIIAFFRKMLPSEGRPWPWDYLPQIQQRLIETIKIALSASIMGASLALPYALIGARNLAAGRWVYNFGRGLLNLIRTVPDIILATVLASAFGIGPLPGVAALTIFTFGVVAKLLCDTVETVDPGPAEAIAAAGGTQVQRAVFAVLPQVAPDFVAYSLYAFEINIRASAVLGLVGAGGIGFILQKDLGFFRYQHVGLIIFVTFLAVLVIDSLSTWLRSKLV
jgi:phosphonate transport system permease protein